MKTSTNHTQRASGRAAVVPPTARTTTGSRPVRRGSFWPGENFTAYTNKWDLTGAFRAAFILPTLAATVRAHFDFNTMQVHTFLAESVADAVAQIRERRRAGGLSC